MGRCVCVQERVARNMCAAPVIAGSLGIRENEISKETEVSQGGAVCLSCGLRPNQASISVRVRYFFPIEWEIASTRNAGHLKSAYVEALSRAELH